MPIIDTSTSRSISNLLRAQQTGFRDTVDEHGKLIRNTQLGGLKSRLVSLVGQGTVKPGSIAGRTIKLVVGKQNFENIFRQLQANADSSVRNVLTAFAKMETKGLDPDLRNAVAVRIHQRLGSRRTGFTARKFASVHNAIKDTLIPERLAARQALITSIEGGRPSPKMLALSETELRIAIEALTTGQSPRQVKNDSGVPFRERVNMNRVMAATNELRLLQGVVANPDEVATLQSQVSRLERGDSASSETSAQLAELRTELEQTRARASAHADTFRGNYVDALSSLYRERSTGEDGLTLPASQYREYQAQEPEPPGPIETPDPPTSRDVAAHAHDPLQGDKKSVSFSAAYTKGDPAAADPAHAQLWKFTEIKEDLTLDQVETALAQADMESLQDPLLSRLERKITRSLDRIKKSQKQDSDAMARVDTAKMHPLCNPEVRFAGRTSHDVEDMKELVLELSYGEPSVSDSKLAVQLYDSLLRIEASGVSSDDERGEAANLMRAPLFGKHVLEYYEQSLSGPGLRDRDRETALHVLNGLMRHHPLSDADQAHAASLMERLQSAGP